MYKISLSVHEIVDFLLRKGSIDNRVFNSASMQEGTRLHSIYQSKQDSNYFREVSLNATCTYEYFEYEIHGRADGIIVKDDSFIIDEIKTTNIDLKKFHEVNKEWHLGQAQFYAYMFAKQHLIDNFSIRLTYISQINDDKEIYNYGYSISEIEKIIEKYIEDYSTFQKTLIKRENLKKNGLKKVVFPYSNIREGQTKIIDYTYECAKNNEASFIEAATGIGKTVASLYGAIQALRDEQIDRMFYLTAKNTGFLNAKKAINLFNKQSFCLTGVEINAKEKSCINSNKVGACNPDECPYTIGYYEKIKDILNELLETNEFIDFKMLENIGKKKMICPFELSLDLSLYVDVIVCDYNYIFNPISYLKRHLNPVDSSKRLFLIVDEAHNLVDRGRTMYSQNLSYSLFDKASPDIKKIKDKNIKKYYLKVKNDFELYKKFEFDKYQKIEIFDEEFIDNLTNLIKGFSNYDSNMNNAPLSDIIDRFSLEVYKFLQIYEIAKENDSIYSFYLSNENNELILNIKCLDASSFINKVVNSQLIKGTVFLSATLSPIDYYQRLILGSSEYKNAIIGTPFDKKHFKVIVNDKISLKYKDRLSTIDETVDEIEVFINFKVGNYIVFVPSFEYLDLLKDRLYNYNGKIIYQERNMDEKSKYLFLNNFKKNPSSSVIGVCVLGGVFSEGIDLVEDMLIGVVVIGIGLPMVNFETNLNKEYFDSLGLNGFEYAYYNVGLNKVMQAVGRLIRTEKDKGVALLIDNRYTYRHFAELFKTTWSNNVRINNSIQIHKILKDFYEIN